MMQNLTPSPCPTCGADRVVSRGGQRANGTSRLHVVCNRCGARRLRKLRTPEYRKEWKRAHRAEYLAHKAVEAALIAGRLVRHSCQRCQSENVHAHHDDYSRHLDVTWLCPMHHKERHRELQDLGISPLDKVNAPDFEPKWRPERAKISQEVALAVIASNDGMRTQREIAGMHGIGQKSVSRILRGEGSFWRLADASGNDRTLRPTSGLPDRLCSKSATTASAARPSVVTDLNPKHIQSIS